MNMNRFFLLSPSLLFAMSAAIGVAPAARAESGWVTLASKTAIFAAGPSEGKPVTVPFSVPGNRGTLRVTYTESPYPPYSRGYSYAGVGTAVQWGSGVGEPKQFIGDFSQVCNLASRPGGGRSPEPPVQGRDAKTISFRHNDGGTPCRNLWAAIFPSVQSVNGRIVSQAAQTISLAIEFKADESGAQAPTGGHTQSGPGPQAIVGSWNWVSGQRIVFKPDGTGIWYQGNNQINEGTWELIDPAARRYRFVLRHGGYVDTVVLSPDGNSLDGTNNSGYPLHGSRISGGATPTTTASPGSAQHPVGGNAQSGPGPRAIVGSWNWVSGQRIVFKPDGTGIWYQGNNQINEGKWELIDPAARRYRFVLRHGGYVDTVVLSPDGNSLDGTNNSGYPLHGRRIP